MPNWSHGLAGVAAALAAAGVWLGRPDLVEAARFGADHLVTLADTSEGGLRVPHVIPDHEDVDTYTYNWCHGPAGTSLLFAALERAGVPAVAGRTPYDWERACHHSLQASGIPERRYPGFWDNDGRCCGTAGVGDVVLNVWQRHGNDDDLAFAITLADAIADRAVRDGDHVYWRFVEHRNDDPLLPPGVGWMQGAAGIAAYLFRLARVLEQGRDHRPSPGWTPGGPCPEVSVGRDHRGSRTSASSMAPVRDLPVTQAAFPRGRRRARPAFRVAHVRRLNRTSPLGSRSVRHRGSCAR